MPLRRIEDAIARLEAVARQSRPQPSVPDPAPEAAAVEASNARLREAVNLSLRQIDAMIARHGTDSQS